MAVIGTGRIGLAFIKKCVGFDMNVLCYDPAYENQAFVKTIQEIHDLRHARGLVKEKAWIKYVPFEEALRGADFVSVHVPLLRAGESATPTYHLFNETTLRQMKPTAYLVNTSRGPVVDETATGARAAGKLDRRGGAGCLREGTAAGGFSATGSGDCRPVPPDAALCQRCPYHPAVDRSCQGDGGEMRARPDRRAGGKLRRRRVENAVCG